MKIGDLVYSEEYNVVGKLKAITNNEATIDLIDVVREDIWYYDKRKCHIASKEEAENFFLNSPYSNENLTK